MNRTTAKRRRMVAVWSLIALLLSQWTMAFHLCLPGNISTAGESMSTSAAHKGCGGEAHQKKISHAQPSEDARCALHCAQPDEISSSVKWPLPDALIANEYSVSPLSVVHGLEPSQPVPDRAPPLDARRRLIEHGALLI
jgi:hypothetical protein